ncbi:MAG: cytochrome c maturation protein CcmE [Paracoccaceae bacterium]
MAGLRKKRRIQLIVLSMTLLVAGGSLIGYAARDGINLFRSPTQIMSNPPGETEVFKLGGLVLEGSIVRGTESTFVVTDTNHDIPVRYVGLDPIPDLFAEGRGTVVTGQMVDGEFVATTILAKHDERYEPAEVIDALGAQGVDINPYN